MAKILVKKYSGKLYEVTERLKRRVLEEVVNKDGTSNWIGEKDLRRKEKTALDRWQLINGMS